MANVFVEENSLQDIANAIREKNGSTDTYKPSEMADAIREISAGSGLDVTKFGIQNEVTGTGIVTCDYVNENEHNVEVKLSSDTITDFSNKQVKVIGKNLFNKQAIVGCDGYSLDENGNILVYGYISTTIKISDAFPSLIVGQTYIFSAKTTTKDNFGVSFKSIGQVKFNTPVIITQDAIDKGVFGIYGGGNATQDNPVIITELQCELGSTVTPYEEYKEVIEYTPNADGTVDVTSISPTMNIICDGVDISAKYYCVPNVERHRFWDNYQDNGNRTNYSYGYSGQGWNDNTFEPKYDIAPVNASGIFSASRITDIKGILERKGKNVIFDNCTDLTYLMNGCVSTTFPDINVSKASNINQLLYGARELLAIRIYGIKESQTMSSSFVLCNKLVDLQLEGVIGKSVSFANSNLLSDASIQNIIDCLADLTGKATQTLTFHADVKAKLTEEQIASITAKNWTLA